MKKVFCVISHTHWDREWYKPYEEFRLKLVDLIDRLLKIIEKYPEYVFHLDAQTVVLEDYLEIHPGNREILKKYIKSGNIIVGPWYLQNDFYLTSGESTIRNLIEGRRVANEFGKCANVGYAPDQFGNISQLPQILNNFGVDSFVFARGFSSYFRAEDGNVYRHHTPLEFVWEGADGTKLTAFHMRGWYNNAQRIPLDPKKAKAMVDNIMGDFHNKISTEYVLLMNGVDHLEAQDDLFEAIESFNAEYSDEAVMKQYTLEKYVKDVKARVAQNNTGLAVHKGELRMGGADNLLPGTLSSRHYIKVANVKMQNMFEQRLEPLYSMLELSGLKGVYSADHFRYGWKKLIQNHPHDTICGCSRDAVHRHSEDNYERLSEFANDMLDRGLTELAYHSEAVKAADGKGYIINIVNTTACEQSGVVKVTADILNSAGIKGFYIEDMAGEGVKFGISSKRTVRRDVTSPLNLPGSLLVDRYDIYMDAGTVKPYSVKGFRIVPDDKENAVIVNKNEAVLENEYVKVTVENLGRIDISFKETGETFKDAIYFEDKADRGNSYNYFGAGDTPITSKGFVPKIEVLENNELCGKIKLTWNMALPKSYDFEKLERSKNCEFTTVSLVLSLSAGDKLLKLDYEIDNRCLDHRLRMVTATGYGKGVKCFADMPFDITERVDYFFDVEPTTQTFPNTSFVSLEEGGHGVALLTEGAHAAEHISEGELAVTLLRATGLIERRWDLEPIGGEMWEAPENQCIRKIKGRLALTGYNGNAAEAGIPNYSIMFRTPLCGIAVPADRRIFAGGRTAVQDTTLEDFFYLPDYWPEAMVKDNASSVTVSGEGIAVSALKQSEDANGIVLRFYNYSEKESTAEISACGNIYRSDMAEESRKLSGKDNVKLSVAPKEIVTLYIEK